MFVVCNVQMKYLFIVDSELESTMKLSNLLQSRSSIKIDLNKKILKFNEFEAACKIKTINNGMSSANSYFTMEIKCKELLTAEKINSEINRIFYKFRNDRVVLLDDGVSRVYSSKAYSILHEVETALRAFITELMTFSNPNWLDEVREILNISSDKDKSDNKVLYSRNFDQLREFLFTDYSDTSYADIIDEILNENDEEKKISLVSEIPNKIPKTNWDRFIKNNATNISIDDAKFQKLLKQIYTQRNKIAHCNEFRKEDYEMFAKNCNTILEYLNKLTEVIIGCMSKDSDLKNEVSAIFTPEELYKSQDTIIVPANEEGFKEVFLGENRWYDVAIWEGRKEYIKYIAAYVTYPKMKITHYAVVDNVDTSPYNSKKKIIYFDGEAKQLSRPIDLGKDKTAFQRSRYTTFSKLQEAKTADDLFQIILNI